MKRSFLPGYRIQKFLAVLSLFLALCAPLNALSDEAPLEEAPADAQEPPSGQATATGTAAASSDEPVAANGAILTTPEATPFTGALSYRIPIELPPGRKGLAPDLALVYNSGRKNGWVGVGWTLDPGCIQRASKWGDDYGTRDFVSSVHGVITELLPRSDWGPTYFGSRIEGAFTKYSYDASRDGWVVTTKNGTRYYYGYHSDRSSQQGDPATGTFRWLLDEVEDTNGNTIAFFYRQDRGAAYPLRIEYTGNKGQKPAYRVDFILEERPDAEISYAMGQRVMTALRLQAVTVAAINPSGQEVKVTRYSLAYATSQSTNRSVLGSVTRHGSSTGAAWDVSLPPHEVIPCNTTDSMERTAWTSTTGTAVRFNAEGKGFNWTGDFNGDGKTDMIGLGSAKASLSLSSSPPADLLFQVRNRLGGTATITYRPSSAYRNTLMPFVLHTVASIAVSDGTTTSLTGYDYAGGLYRRETRDFYGFRYVARVLSGDALEETWFLQDEDRGQYRGLMEAGITRRYSDGALLTGIANVYETVSYGDAPARFPKLVEKVETLFDGDDTGTQMATRFLYDDFGNITARLLEGDITVAGDERYEYTTYADCNRERWIMDRPVHASITDGAGTLFAETRFGYDGGNPGDPRQACPRGNLTAREEWLAQGQSPLTRYGYDAYGNLVSVTDPRGNVTAMTYDAGTQTPMWPQREIPSATPLPLPMTCASAGRKPLRMPTGT